MKKRIMLWAFCAVFLSVLPASALSASVLEAKKPPRPEKIVEQIPDRPSQYHVWREGRWKWKSRDQQWIWKEGNWSFDQDYYNYKNFYRNRWANNFRYRSRYVAVPVGRGFYRIVRY